MHAGNQPGLAIALPVRRIAVLRALFLGDLICATPALRALHHRFPEAEMTLIGLPWAADLVARLPYLHHLAHFPGYPSIVEVPYDPERTAAWLDAARREPFDLAIQMHGSGRQTNGFVAALGARVSIGYHPGRDDRVTATLPWRDGEHEVDRWLRLVGLVGATGEPAPVDWPITAGEWARAAALLPGNGGPLIGLHAGAKDPARRWPPARFAALGDALYARYGARLVLTGTASERPITAAVRRAMRAPALDLAGETDVGTFAALIARLGLLVTNDTGASHLAAATGTRSVVLFGPSDPGQWAPRDRQRHRALNALTVTGIADPAAALAALPVPVVLAACAAALAPSPPSRERSPLVQANPGQEALCAG